MSALAVSDRASRDVLVRNPPRRGVVSRPDFHFFHGDLRGGGFYCLALAGHVGRDQPFYALTPPGHDGGPIASDFETLVVDQLALLRAVRPRGPYRLGGYCNGALVAYEVARRLVAAGRASGAGRAPRAGHPPRGRMARGYRQAGGDAA